MKTDAERSLAAGGRFGYVRDPFSASVTSPGVPIARRNRSLVVHPDQPETWHVNTRCAREIFLLDEPPAEFGEDDRSFDELSGDRKRLLLDRLKRLADVFSIDVLGHSVMGNHLHLLLRSNPAEARAWSAVEVIRRWYLIHPPSNRQGPIELSAEDLAAHAADAEFVAATRRKLMDLSQMMKDLKQYVAVEINKLEGRGGVFWGGRFKCKPITDHERGQLVRTMVYIDLNPFAAGLCATPEAGAFTSLASRLETSRLEGAAGAQAWLAPLEGDAAGGSSPMRVVMPGLTLPHYLALLDCVARLLRDGKASLPRGAPSIFVRLGLDAEDLLASHPRFARGSPHG